MSLPHAPRLRTLLAILDTLALAFAVWVAHLVRFGTTDRATKWAQLFHHPGLIVVSMVSMWAIAAAAELYEPLQLRRRTESVVRLAVVTALWGTAVVVATYAVPSWQFGRGLLLLTSLVWAVLAAAVRSGVARRLRSRVRSRALVVGEAAAVAEECERLRAHPFSAWEPLDGSGLPRDAVAAEARRLGVEIVILVGGETSGAPAADLAAVHFSGVPVAVASEVWAWLEGRLPVAELSPATFLHQPGFGAIHAERFNLLTRVFDVLLAGLMFALTSPLLALAALATLFLDGWPVVYVQTRAGQFGRAFRLYKLRTMRRDAESNGPAFASEDDPRMTRLGRVLRRLRIDELPQLVNVLKGEMSLVGPRPERPEFVAELARAIPFYTFRLAVPPGLTGWAQINMAYARTLEEHRRKLEYDLYFIRERSVGIYLFTLLRTASAALVGAGR